MWSSCRHHLRNEVYFIMMLKSARGAALIYKFLLLIGIATFLIICYITSVSIYYHKVTPKDISNMCRCQWNEWPISTFTENEYFSKIPWLNDTTMSFLRRRHPNFPSQLLFESRRNKNCHLLPTEFSVEWQNTYWQKVSLSSESTLLLYSAFYDPRNDTKLGPCIRLLGVSQSEYLPYSWCHLWFNVTESPIVSKVNSVDYIDFQERNKNRQMPFLLTCDIPTTFGDLVPRAVSIVPEPCMAATTLLKVVGGRERTASAYTSDKELNDSRDLKGHAPAVCGPALYYYHEDFSFRIVEWLEMLRALGFRRVFLYQTEVHPNIEKVLRYYEREGFLQLTMYAYPPPYINEPNTRRMWTLMERDKMFAQENIYFTDCILRHMHEHRFIAHYDPDEMPVLPRHLTYTQFLDEMLESTYNGTLNSWFNSMPTAYSLEWKFFNNDLEPKENNSAAKDLPHYLWILRHISKRIQYWSSLTEPYKPLYDMNVVRAVNSHVVLLCVTGNCKGSMKYLDSEIAYLAHFKNECGEECQKEGSTVEEPALHKHKEEVTREVSKVLRTIGLI